MNRQQRLFLSLFVVAVVVALTAPTGVMGLRSASRDDDVEIREVVTSAYLEGMHRNKSRAQARAGFHPDFTMFVRRPDHGIQRVGIEEWIARLQPEGTAPDHSVSGNVTVLSREGGAAAAKAEVAFDGKQVFTDYFLLYRLDGQWRIVAKTFEVHR